MADIWSKSKRSAVMSLIRSRGNKNTELRLIEIFLAARITGWRRSQKLVGKPDFVFRDQRVVIFVDGCFWHCCPEHASWPDTNRSFWRQKLEGNILRDAVVNRTLRKDGWRVMRIWQHELKKGNELQLVARLRKVGLTSKTMRMNQNESSS